MRLELIESFTIPSDTAKPNEDSFAVAARAVAVFDGATGLGERLMPGPSDAAWIAHFAARRFRSHAEAGPRIHKGKLAIGCGTRPPMPRKATRRCENAPRWRITRSPMRPR